MYVWRIHESIGDYVKLTQSVFTMVVSSNLVEFKWSDKLIYRCFFGFTILEIASKKLVHSNEQGLCGRILFGLHRAWADSIVEEKWIPRLDKLKVVYTDKLWNFECTPDRVINLLNNWTGIEKGSTKNIRGDYTRDISLQDTIPREFEV